MSMNFGWHDVTLSQYLGRTQLATALQYCTYILWDGDQGPVIAKFEGEMTN